LTSCRQVDAEAPACGPTLLQVRVPKEESSMVSDLRYGWKKLKKLATDVSDNLTRMQVGTCTWPDAAESTSCRPVMGSC
jgi:hypothetical protein